MARRSKVVQLPREIREWLDRALAEKNFAGYRQFEQELAARGFTIGKSAIQRYGANLERKLAAIKDSTEAAVLIAKAAPDDAGEREAAVMSMLNTEIFNVLINAQQLNDEKDPAKRMKLLSSLAASVSKLSRSSISQKKHAIEVRAKTEAAADKVARLAKKGGLSGSTVENIKREILGIAG